MKICILTSSYPVKTKLSIGGIGSFERDIAIELTKLGNEVHVITPKQPGIDFNDLGIKIHRFWWKFNNKEAELSSLKLFSVRGFINICSIIINGQITLFKLHRIYKFDIFFALWALPAGFWTYILSKFTNIPYVIWTLGSDIWDYGRKPLTKTIVRLILKNSTKLYSDGFKLAEETSKLANKPCKFLASTRNLSKTLTNDIKIPFEKAKINFLFVGRYHVNKGPDVLLDAISILPTQISKKCNFFLYGGGDMHELLTTKKKNHNLKNVFINGFVGPEKLVALLKTADFLIIPSREDSIPVILSDALQFNLPVIVSNVGDMGDLVKKYKVGFVFQKGSIKQLADNIFEATKISKSVFNNKIKNIMKIFNISNVAKELNNDFIKIKGKS